MPNMITVPSHCMVTVLRPNGVTETINYTEATKGRVFTMTAKIMAMANKAMADAKRGEIIAFENITKDIEERKPSAADIAEECYIREHNAILRASAGGEPCDEIKGMR